MVRRRKEDTHRPLESMVEDGSFRADLWYRLNVFPLRVPALRQRIQDLPELVRHFVSVKCRELKLGAPPDLAPGALDPLLGYGWPGNVRELENVVERALILHVEGPLEFGVALSPAAASALSLRLDDVVARHIEQVLARCEQRIEGEQGAAAQLGLHPSTLHSKMRKLGLRFTT